MIKQNLHTHSTYCDGKNSLEDMVKKAIEKNFTVLGFSGHSYIPKDEDCMSIECTKEDKREVLRLKEKYKDSITIYLGLEQDIRLRDPHPEDYDYMIGSMHFLSRNDTYIAVDYDESVIRNMLETWYDNNFLKLAAEYYEQMKVMATWDEVDIIGHVDLLTKYNEEQIFISFDNKEYVKLACDTIDILIHAGKIFEVNTGAIGRGYRKTPYPYKNLLQHIHDKGGKILLNSDCHNKDYLDIGYEQSMRLIKDCGFTSMMVLTDEGFKEVDINLFGI